MASKRNPGKEGSLGIGDGKVHNPSRAGSKPIPNSKQLDLVNQKLKAAGVRLRVVVQNRKLYLRGTLPPRPGLIDNKPRQTLLALSLDATPYGYKTALSKAFEVWAALGQNQFSWSDYIVRNGYADLDGCHLVAI